MAVWGQQLHLKPDSMEWNGDVCEHFEEGIGQTWKKAWAGNTAGL